MTQKEANRLHVMKLIDSKQVKIKRASEILGISERQTKRIRKAYKQNGIEGLISKRRGKPSHNKIPDNVKRQIAKIIAKRYTDFGPTLACEKLKEKEEIKVSVETIRQIMIKNNLWQSQKQKKVIVHQMRSRRSKRGSLVQIDGSYHRWFEGRTDPCCLIVFVDDATSEIATARFCKHETTQDYLEALKKYLLNHGRPLAFYSDRHSIFKVNNKQYVTGREISYFARVLKDLDIELICANSPQAKGRVERKNGVLQDRLIKEMRLDNISTIDEGNIYLEKYVKRHNERFGKQPLSAENAHRPLNFNEDLERTLAPHEQRKLSKNLTFQYEGILYQINPSQATFGMKHAGITIINCSGTLEVEYKGQKLSYTKGCEVEPQARIFEKRALAWIEKQPRKINRDHPWR